VETIDPEHPRLSIARQCRLVAISGGRLPNTVLAKPAEGSCRYPSAEQRIFLLP
jgi:hypothetical protein